MKTKHCYINQNQFAYKSIVETAKEPSHISKTENIVVLYEYSEYKLMVNYYSI